MSEPKNEAEIEYMKEKMEEARRESERLGASHLERVFDHRPHLCPIGCPECEKLGVFKFEIENWDDPYWDEDRD